jgi:hypothetical protein
VLGLLGFLMIKHFLGVLVVSLLPLVALLLRGVGWGADSFAFYALGCGNVSLVSQVSSDFFGRIVLLFGCDFVFISILMWLFYFLALLSLWQIGKLVLGKNAWLLPVYCGTLTPLLFIEGLRFENDLFGWSLAFMAIALFCLALKAKRWLKVPLLLFSCVIGIVSVLIWSASLLLLPIALLLLPIKLGWKTLLTVLVFLGFILFKWGYILNSFNLFHPAGLISEEIPLLGLVFVLHIAHFWRKTPQPFALYGTFLFIFGAIKAKYMFLATPFLLMAVIQKEKSVGLFLGKVKFPIHPLIFCAIFGISLVIMATNLYPIQTDLKEIKDLIQISGDQNIPIYNDWGTGWLFVYEGYNTRYKASRQPGFDWNELKKPYLAYSTTDLPCNKIPKTRYSYFCS